MNNLTIGTATTVIPNGKAPQWVADPKVKRISQLSQNLFFRMLELNLQIPINT